MKIIVIIFTILIFFIFYFINYYVKNNKFNSKNGFNSKDTKIIKYDYISVIILNYSRPYNLDKLLPYINKHKLINEIIVLHGNPLYCKYYKYNKVKNYKDFENNKLYGGARRFKGISYAKNNLVMFIDDDTIPTFELIDNLYTNLINNINKNTIYGPINRTCDKKGYIPSTLINKDRINVILTPCVLTKKSIIETFNKKYFNYFEDWFIKYKGNCEDLSLNLFIYKYYKNIPVIVKGKLIELDTKNGYSSKNNHLQIRNTFCKKYF